MKSSGIGGQAVLEGVMMKNKNCYAIAVRKPNNEIEVKKEEISGTGERRALFKVPIFRGIATFVESLVLGMHALTYSSSFYEEEEGQKEVSKAKETLVDIGVVVLSVLMAIVVFILFPLFISSMLGRVIKSETLQLVVEGFLRLFMFIAYIALISRLNDIKRVFMYHGAEHKCINCVEQGYELTIANVKKQSKCHKRCGTSFMLVVMLVSFVLFMFIRVEEAWLRYVLRIVLIPVVAGISYEFIRLAGNTENKIVNFLSRPGLWMQGLTTREPDDSMIEVAIASVEAVFDWRAYQEKEGIAKYRKDSLGRTGKKEQQNEDSNTKGSSFEKSPVTPGAASGSAVRSEKPVSVASGSAVRSEKPASVASGSAVRSEKPVSAVSGSAVRNEKPASAVSKDRRVERPSSGSRPETKTAAVNRKKENSPAAGSIRKEEKPVAKSVRKEEKPAGKSSAKIEAPIARTGIKEDRPAARIGGAEKAMPRSGVKTIKPLGKAEGKLEKPTGKSGSQGEKSAAKVAAKPIKAAGKENREILSENGKEEKTMPKGVKKDRKPTTQNSSREMPEGIENAITAKEEKGNIANTAMPVDEKVAVETQGIEVSEETEGKIQAAAGIVAEGAQKVAGNEAAAVSKEAAEEARENTVSEKTAVNEETAQEIVASEEAAQEAQEIVSSEENAEEAREIPVRETAMEAPQKMAVNSADEKAAGQAEVKTANEENPAVPDGNAILDKAKETRNGTKNREQDRRKTNLISFMSTPDDEEDDEILRALDRYFVYGEDGSEENH